MDIAGNADCERRGELIDEVTLKPHQSVLLDVGIYESTMPQPTLDLEYEPDVGQGIGVTLQRHDGRGEYALQLQLENFGDVACAVKVWKCEDSDGSR